MEHIQFALLIPFLILVVFGFFLFFPSIKYVVQGVHAVLFTNLSKMEKLLLLGMGIALALKIAS
jgi:hypothetical protein